MDSKEKKNLNTNEKITLICLTFTTIVIILSVVFDSFNWFWGIVSLSVMIQWINFFSDNINKSRN